MENRLRMLDQQYGELMNREATLNTQLRTIPMNSPTYNGLSNHLNEVRMSLANIKRERDMLQAQIAAHRQYAPYPQQGMYGAPQPGYGGYQSPPPPGGYGMLPRQQYYPTQPAYGAQPPMPAYQPYQPTYAPQPQPYYGQPNRGAPITPMGGYQQPVGGYQPMSPSTTGSGGVSQYSNNQTASKYDRYAGGLQNNPPAGSVPPPPPVRPIETYKPYVSSQPQSTPQPTPVKKEPEVKNMVELLDDQYKGCKITPTPGTSRTLRTKRTKEEVTKVASKFNNLVNRDNEIESANVTNLRMLLKELAVLDEPGIYIDKILSSYLNLFMKMNGITHVTVESIVSDLDDLIKAVEGMDSHKKEGFKEALLRLAKVASTVTIKYEEHEGEGYVSVYYKQTKYVFSYGVAEDYLDPIRRDITIGIATKVTRKDATELFNILNKHPEQSVVSVAYECGVVDKHEVFFYKVDEDSYISIPNPISK